jgi:hypothetical protein
VAAEGGRVGCLSQREIDRLQNGGETAIDLVVPKTKDAKATAGETGIALHVSRLTIIEIVLTSIEFDNQPMLQANKIDNEIVTWRLPSEVISPLSPSAEVNPEFYLLGCHGFSQSSCDRVCHCPHPARYARHPPPAGEG